MRTSAVALSCVLTAAIAATPAAAAKPAGKVSSVSVAPASAILGSDVTASVELANPRARRSRAIPLLIKLRAPDGSRGVVVGSERVPPIRPGKSRVVEVPLTVPADATTGANTLVACRAKRGSADACGVSRQTTPLEVLAEADLRLTPATQAFGSQPTGTASAAEAFEVTNSGDVPSGPISTAIGGGDSGQFTISSDGCDGQALAAGASCTVEVEFAPSSTGSKAAILQASATPGGSVTAGLSGTGVNPAALTIAPQSEDFGTHASGTTSPPQTFTVTNSGDVSSGPISTAIGGGDSGQFTISSDGCDGQALAAGASCTVEARFAPTSAGDRSASLTATATPGGTASADLIATGAPPANLTISPGSHDFGDIAVATATPPQTFTVTNTGGVPSGSISTALAGTDVAEFTKSADSCQGATLLPGESCSIAVTFAPQSTGSKTASIEASATPGGTATAALSGSAATPANLTISPGDNVYDDTVVNTTSAAQTFTVTNTGGIASGSVSAELGGSGASQFTMSGDTCTGQTLDPGESCTVNAVFSPTTAGDHAARLQASATPGGTASATLAGTALTPANLTLTPAGRDYGNVLQGTASATTRFTVTNAGEQAATGVELQLSGPQAASFEGSGSTCGSTLAGSATCTIDVRFAPAAAFAGPASATLSVDSDVGGTDSSSLSGNSVTTPANLQIALQSPPSSSAPPNSDFGASDTVGTNSSGINAVRVWLRNTGAADAHIPQVGVTLHEAEMGVDPSSTCSVETGFGLTQITFTDPIDAGATCFVELHIIGTPSTPPFQPWGASFTISAKDGNSVTGSITGVRPGA